MVNNFEILEKNLGEIKELKVIGEKHHHFVFKQALAVEC